MAKKLSLSLVAGALWAATTAPASADPISYTIKGIAAGTFGSVNFDFTGFMVVLVADTTSIVDITGGRTNLATITAMEENPTFTADLDPGLNGILPEPGTLGLFALGLLCLFHHTRRRPTAREGWRGSPCRAG